MSRRSQEPTPAREPTAGELIVQERNIPALGLGTWQLDGTACTDAVAAAVDLGYRHIDTAQMYGNETEVGRGLAAAGVDRGDLWVTTKIGNADHAPEDVRRSTDDSLRRLGTDYVDLLLIHWPVAFDQIDATLDAMVGLQQAGHVRHIGVSNFTPQQLRRALERAPVFAVQVEYHPYLGQHRLRELCVRHDLLLTAYSPLARGRVLSDPVLHAVAAAHDASPAQVALRWLLDQDVAAIPKASSRSHLATNLGALDLRLSDDERRRIDALERGGRLIDPPFAPEWEAA